MATTDMLKILILCLFFSFGFTDYGQITTWTNDEVNKYCRQDSTEWCKSNYCSAPTVAALCPMKPGWNTSEANKFKQLCINGEDGNGYIDGRYITEAARNSCLNCTIPVCDLQDYPAVDFECKQQICVTANSKRIQTYQMDVCPSNHQKNVAKCCMWGGAWCSCVTTPTMDLSLNAYQALGSVQYGSWNIGETCTNTNGSGGGGGCDDKQPPGDYTCQQQKDWGKCDQPWMKGYCRKTCGKCCNYGSKCGGSTNNNKCGNSCSDTPPPNSGYTCQQQKDWGKCNEKWMDGYCCKSCKNAKQCGGSGGNNKCGSSCSNTPPPGNSYTCEDQAKWGKCNEKWMEGYCCKSCANSKKCGGAKTCGNSCSDTPPPNSGYTCQQQKDWGKCNEKWMDGYCCKSCKNAKQCGGSGGNNKCGSSCSNTPPPGNSYTCEDQAKWGKCNEKWMEGYCCKSCANSKKCGGAKTCGNSCSDTPPPNSGYTCQQQKDWGKCNEKWMDGYCCKSCKNAKQCGGSGGNNKCGSSCSNTPPPGNSYTCEDQAKWGKCNEKWMEGYCCKSCANSKKCGGAKTCGNSCSDTPPPNSGYTCQQQKDWGKCNEKWMDGYCCKSCKNAKQCGGSGGNNKCGSSCSNTPPPGNSYTCKDQAKWGKCNEKWMEGYCCKSCKNAKQCGGGGGGGKNCGNSCSDSPPPNSGYSCSDQAKWGKCNESWMAGYCCKSCANAYKCGGSGGGAKTCGSSCSDSPPPNSGYSCSDQAKWGKCKESWMTGYCCKSCANAYKCGGGGGGGGGKTCGNSCSDYPPPNSGYSCSDQAKWGKCNESWMAGYCCKSCKNAYTCGGTNGGGGGCDDKQPPGGYTCQQKKAWGKCNESWMKGYCRKTCGKCYL